MISKFFIHFDIRQSVYYTAFIINTRNEFLPDLLIIKSNIRSSDWLHYTNAVDSIVVSSILLVKLIHNHQIHDSIKKIAIGFVGNILRRSINTRAILPIIKFTIFSAWHAEISIWLEWAFATSVFFIKKSYVCLFE